MAPAPVQDFVFSAVVSTFALILTAFTVAFLRRRAALRAAASAPVLVAWRAPDQAWQAYLSGKSRTILSAVFIWLALYSLATAAFMPGGSFAQRWATNAAYGVMLIGLPLFLLWAAARMFPARYVLTEQGAGSAAWVPVLMRPGAGFIDMGFVRWDKVRGYRWDGDVLLLQGQRGFGSQGFFELLVPDEQRKAVQEALRRVKVDKGEGLPALSKPSAKTSKGRAARGKKGR